VVVLNVLAVANIPRAVFHGRAFEAFLSSAASIAAFVFLFGLALFPNLAVSSLDPPPASPFTTPRRPKKPSASCA
jgi:cytochrome d ubiquinol oxidase subunit II